MKSKKLSTESAVSPVVGVMLMLVVTIVIAAVVAAFAGGLTTTTSVTPTITLKADLSCGNGLVLTSLGMTEGDTTDFDIYIGSDTISYNIGKSSTGSFKPGTVIPVGINKIQNKFNETYGEDNIGSGLYVGPRNIGSIYTIELRSGSAILGKTTATLMA